MVCPALSQPPGLIWWSDIYIYPILISAFILLVLALFQQLYLRRVLLQGTRLFWPQSTRDRLTIIAIAFGGLFALVGFYCLMTAELSLTALTQWESNALYVISTTHTTNAALCALAVRAATRVGASTYNPMFTVSMLVAIAGWAVMVLALLSLMPRIVQQLRIQGWPI